LVVALLLYVGRRFEDRLLSGDLLLIYGILYPLGRFLVEFQRPDAWTIGAIPTAQIIAVVSMVVCAGLLIYRHRIAARPPAPETDQVPRQVS
jgi:phosphatidylglycerol:prolipoprotein diacylglycerol transferase